MTNVEKQYVSHYGMPFEVTGTFTNGDKSLMIHGSLAQMDVIRARGAVTSGRFDASELIPITKQEADTLLNILLRSPIDKTSLTPREQVNK